MEDTTLSWDDRLSRFYFVSAFTSSPSLSSLHSPSDQIFMKFLACARHELDTGVTNGGCGEAIDGPHSHEPPMCFMEFTVL